MMNKSILALIIVGLLLPTAALAAGSSNDLRLSLESTDENIQPGGTFTLRVTFENIGTSGLSDITYNIISGSDITGYSRTSTILGALSQDSMFTKEITFSVSGDASNKIHTISIVASYTKDGILHRTQENYKFMVGSDVQLNLKTISFDNELLEPGKTYTMYAEIENVGTHTAKQLTATFAPTNVTQLKPVFAGSTDFANEIKPGNSETFEFQFSVDSGADSKTYAGSISFAFEDVDKNSLTDSFTVGIPVKGQPIIEILNTEVNNGKFEVEIENIGTEKAKAIKVQLVQNDELLGVDVDNELKADKHTTMRFTKYQKGVATLKISYLDNDNQPLENEIQVSIESSSADYAAKNGASTPTIILGVVVLISLVYIVKLRRDIKKLSEE